MNARESAIVIVDDDDNEPSASSNEPAPFTRRARALSLISHASSCTLAQESPEPEELPDLERLSVQPQEVSVPPRRRRLSNDSDEKESSRRRRVRYNNQAAREVIDLEEAEIVSNPFGVADEAIIDIDTLEAKIEEEIAKEEEEQRRTPRGRSRIPFRNPQINLPLLQIDVHLWKEVSLRANKTVELTDGSFMKIKAIIRNLQTEEVILRGWKLQRTKNIKEYRGILLMMANELCFTFEVDKDDAREILEQSVDEVTLDDVVRVRKLICTNRPFPEYRFDPEFVPRGPRNKVDRTYIEENEVLVARWKLVTMFDNADARMKNMKKFDSYGRGRVEKLLEKESSPGYGTPAHVLRYNWRGETTLGGSGYGRDGRQVYTYGDNFSGGGGTTRAAYMAGLKLVFAMDMDSDACSTLRANFPLLKIFQEWAHEFALRPDPNQGCKVDFLHCSPPCPFFSPAHTRAGQNDEANEVAMFAIGPLIKKSTPRLATLEQTFGIMHHRFRNHFNQLVRQFTDHGYSVSWKKVNFAEFGLPQSRQRLILMAAGPGDILPEFPAYTHSQSRTDGLKPYTSVRSVLNAIPRGAPNHDIGAATNTRAKYTPWDDLTITTCIMTNGGERRGHPNGTRGLTHREFAALQGFPHNHIFPGRTGRDVKRRIGDAVPPSIARIIFEAGRKHLQSVDRDEMEAFIVEG